MKIYLAGECGDGDIQARMKRRLFSYWYHHKGNHPSRDVLSASDNYKLDLFLDSGAFTAFVQKVDIKVEDYAAYYHNVKQRFTVCSSLDAVGDPVKSYENLKALESLGCQVVPVFHAREDVKWLVKYMDEGYDYIFLGGMVPESTPWLEKWLDNLFTHYLTKPNGEARIRVHGFGLTTESLMFRYPWYSLDSSSWTTYSRFGWCILLLNGRQQRIIFSERNQGSKKWSALFYRNLPQEMKDVIDQELLGYDVTAAQCEEHFIYRDRVNAQTYTRMEALAQPVFKRHEYGLFSV